MVDMCEFKVLLRGVGEVKDVASDIIYAKLEGDGVVLRDIIGREHRVSSAIVEEIDVSRENLKLLHSPILSLVLKFIKEYERCVEQGVYSEALEELWEEVKAEGSSMIRSLWVKLKS